MTIERGSVVLVDLDPTTGHEQRGVRPCIVVSDPEVASDQRFPMIAIVPVTGTPGLGALYPALQPGRHTGLTKTSYALVDQIRAIDKTRVVRRLGRIDISETAALNEGLELFLGLAA